MMANCSGIRLSLAIIGRLLVFFGCFVAVVVVGHLLMPRKV